MLYLATHSGKLAEKQGPLPVQGPVKTGQSFRPKGRHSMVTQGC